MKRGKPRRSGKREPQGVHIIHDDAHIIVVDKPPGLLTIGTERERERTLYFRLTDYVRKGQARSRNRVFIVHRLDRDASGLLVFAKTPEAKERLQATWDEAEKKYLAVVRGTPVQQEGTVSSYLAENRALMVYSTPDPQKGKLSQTNYRVLEGAKGFTLLEIDLLTGRKHQIRVHLAELGYPILGDKKYGKEKEHKRLALHAVSLAFSHPFTGERVRFETPIPNHFLRLLGRPPTVPPARP